MAGASGSYSIRDATPADYELYVRLAPELGVPDDPPDRERYLARIVDSSFVLSADRREVGWGLVHVLDGIGYVRQIMLEPAARGRGLGRALMEECLGRFRSAGCVRFCLNVLPGNAVAIGLYESMGLAVSHACCAVKLPWQHLGRLPAARGAAGEPSADLASAAERAWGVPSGQIVRQVGDPSWHVRVLEDGGAIRGVASFDPTFPGCSIFRAEQPGHARALLESLRPAARPGDEVVQVVLEDAEPLALALEAAGGWRTLEFLHMQGELPRP